ncbi:hypothetical protein [Klebsiella quasipneumoniae]|uniref:hypothetical protein n=1 Tax=Klebsiella quasipneumoniae TaxID=1463165 RepID=UPI0023B05807|nr:hypothetical protein [Klebsiella quasipneumoniae]
MNNINNLPENYRNISTMRSIYDETVNIHFVAVPNPESNYCDLELWFCESSTGELLEVKKYEEITDEALIQAIARHNEAHPEDFVRNGHPETKAGAVNVNFDSSTDEQEESPLPLESANASKALHHPSPEEISDGANKEYEARRAALKELLESGDEIKAIPKTAYHTKEFSDALATALVSDPHFSIPASYKHHPAFQKPNPKKPKPNRNLDTIMGLLARTKK